MHKKKILVISVSAGAGHVRAAEALHCTARRFFPELETVHIDMMDYVSRPMRTAIVDVYDMLAKALPDVWGFIYKTANETKTMKRFYRLIRSVNQFNARKLFAFLEEYQPDEIICTHSFPAQVIRQSAFFTQKNIPLHVVITDYGFHKFWLIEGVTRYFVGNEKNKWELMHEGVAEEKISVTGIPVAPEFFEHNDSVVQQKMSEVSHDTPQGSVYQELQTTTVLVLAGGQGFIRSDEIVGSLCDTWNAPTPLRIIAVSGRNKTLYAKLQELKNNIPKNLELTVVEWTDRIDQYMRQADVIVTKAGGITTTEAMILGKPLIIMHPLPGQEEENARFILESGAGVIARSTEELLYYLSHQKTLPRSTQIKNPREGGGYTILKTLL